MGHRWDTDKRGDEMHLLYPCHPCPSVEKIVLNHGWARINTDKIKGRKRQMGKEFIFNPF
jgi:hypothetical protein